MSRPELVEVGHKTFKIRRHDESSSVLTEDAVQLAKSNMEQEGFEVESSYRVENWGGGQSRRNEAYHNPRSKRIFENDTPEKPGSRYYLRIFLPNKVLEFGPFIHPDTNRKEANKAASRAMDSWVRMTCWMIDTVPMGPFQ